MVAIQSIEKRFSHSISAGVSLVDFNAPWCKPCRVQAPIIKALEKNFHGTANMTTLNIDENREIALKLGIQSIPTIIIYKDGREMNRFVGIQTTQTLIRALRDVIDQSNLSSPRR